MTSANKIVEDLSRVMSGALGVASDAKDEAANSMKAWIDKQFNERGYVTREEFEVVAEMAKTARREIDELKKELNKK